MWHFHRFLVAKYSIYPQVHTVKTPKENFGSDGCGFEFRRGRLIYRKNQSKYTKHAIYGGIVFIDIVVYSNLTPTQNSQNIYLLSSVLYKLGKIIQIDPTKMDSFSFAVVTGA
jgi:hypothetical protein